MARVTKAKKKWIKIIAPSIFRNKELGEISLAEPESFVGKRFSVNLMNITGNVKKQNINMYFEASNVKDSKINTEVVGFEMQPSSVKRMVRRGRDKLNISFVCKTSDNKYARIKPIIVTLSKVTSSVANSLYREIVNTIAAKAAKTSFDNLVVGLVNRKLQSTWRDAVKKVYPIRIFDIRAIRKEDSKKAAASAVKVSKPAKKAKAEEDKNPSKSKKAENKEAPKEEKKPEIKKTGQKKEDSKPKEAAEA